MKAASDMYLIQNSAVACSALSILAALSAKSHSVPFWTSIVLLMAFGTISSAGALGATLSIEKEWVKALCGHDSAFLAATNSGESSRLSPQLNKIHGLWSLLVWTPGSTMKGSGLRDWKSIDSKPFCRGLDCVQDH